MLEERKEENKKVKHRQNRKISKVSLLELELRALHGFITKAIHSLGSINLLNISQTIHDKENTPASFVVNHGIKMWYAKNLRVDEMAKRIEEKDFSKTAERLMKFKVVEHCRLHHVA